MDNTTANAFVSGFKRSYKLVIAVLIVGFILAGVAAVKVHTKYSANANVLAIDGSSQIDQASDNVSGAKNPILLGDLPMLASSTQVLTNVSRDLNGALSVDQLRSGVRASGNSSSAVVHVQYTAKDPMTAMKVTNTIAHEVAKYFRTISTSRYDSVIKDLTQQLAVLNQRLEALDTTLGAQAKQYPYVDVKSTSGGEGESVYARLTQLRSLHADAAAAVAADRSNLAASMKLIDNSKPVAERELVESDPVYKNIAEQYAKDNQELQHIKSFGNYSYPGLRELESTVENEGNAVADARAKILKRSLNGNASYAAANDAITHTNAQLAADTARLTAIDTDRERLERDIGSGSIASEVSRIRRDRDDTDAAYRVMATKLSEAEADRAQAAAIGSLMVLDEATFASAQSLSSGRYMAMGIIFLTLWIAGSIIMFAKPAAPRRVEPMYSFDGHVSNVTHEDRPRTPQKIER